MLSYPPHGTLLIVNGEGQMKNGGKNFSGEKGDTIGTNQIVQEKIFHV